MSGMNGMDGMGGMGMQCGWDGWDGSVHVMGKDKYMSYLPVSLYLAV